MKKTAYAFKSQPSIETSANLSLPTRMRRTRRTEWMRRMVTENHVTVSDLIWPV
ncbi:MAG: porphobilinogen synthase, partial [Alphaproteobacteria bacterium]|nr:porphobilinogen synthase [Alphaproteobacteria bacterium]